MKRLFLLALCSLSAIASQLVVHKDGLLAPSKLGALALLKTEGGYEVFSNGERHKVHNYDVSPNLKKMNSDQLAHFLNNGHGRVTVNQFNNGEYKLDLLVRGQGGGGGGATAGWYVGKIGTYVVCHGAIQVAGAAAGFFSWGYGYWPVVTALEKTFALQIEHLSNVVAIGTAIGGGVATGPV